MPKHNEICEPCKGMQYQEKFQMLTTNHVFPQMKTINYFHIRENLPELFLQ